MKFRTQANTLSPRVKQPFGPGRWVTYSIGLLFFLSFTIFFLVFSVIEIRDSSKLRPLKVVVSAEEESSCPQNINGGPYKYNVTEVNSSKGYILDCSRLEHVGQSITVYANPNANDPINSAYLNKNGESGDAGNLIGCGLFTGFIAGYFAISIKNHKY